MWFVTVCELTRINVKVPDSPQIAPEAQAMWYLAVLASNSGPKMPNRRDRLGSRQEYYPNGSFAPHAKDKLSLWAVLAVAPRMRDRTELQRRNSDACQALEEDQVVAAWPRWLGKGWCAED